MNKVWFFSFPCSSVGMQLVTLLRHGAQERPCMDSHGDRGNQR